MIKELIVNCKLKIARPPTRQANCRRGFTLIELLIVIAIIGVLSTLLMANFVGVRQRARDAQRKSDLRQIQSALELYRADNSIYPTSDFPTTCGTGVSFIKSGATAVTYMQTVPCDPLGGPYIYLSPISITQPDTYSITACLENASDSQKDTTNTCNAPSSHWSYTIINP